jgi:exosortase/archaeosortase family protein
MSTWPCSWPPWPGARPSRVGGRLGNSGHRLPERHSGSSSGSSAPCTRTLCPCLRQTLGTPAFQLEIAPQCSGYEGIALILVFVAVYLWLFRRELRFPHTLLLPVGVLAIWFANVLRITALIALGTSVSAGVALGGFHSQAGWLFFLAVSLGLMAVSHRVRLFAAPAVTRPEASGGPRDATEAATLLVPVLVLLASVMVTSAISSGFDRPLAEHPRARNPAVVGRVNNPTFAHKCVSLCHFPRLVRDVSMFTEAA